ncbi:juvenile hormone epoxide hydrolase-like [Pectinophora gossypiella]|uniref:juvenile hormone epoxide hydrolase-like n=1 Tax=Pectinophora gossypiella TaxID=13191 RepID=UPI00214EEBDB|nr:juvenile hormone epoxide hydrolase-like [Pectinophora gossypiella]
MPPKDKGRKGKDSLNTSKAKDEKETKKCRSCCKILLVLSSLAVALIAIASYQLYVKFTIIPDMPDLDLNIWWGPNTTERQDTSIRRFRIVFSDAMQEELRKKFEVYRAITSRKKSITEDWTYGTNSDALAQVFAHWQFKYTMSEREKFLNQFDHFKTNIQGLDIHFVHVKPKVDENVKVVPLLLLHGWPGSVREFYDVIPLLTTPRPGYDFVFEVIAPSLPGFLYSQAPTKPGLSNFQIAIIMRNLMHRIGFTKYYIQGGDYGHAIGTDMSTIFPQEVLGFHTNMPIHFSKLPTLVWMLGSIWPSIVANGLEDRMYPLKDKIENALEEFGYLHLQMTKPDTIGIALTDSPMGLLSYIIDRFIVFTDHTNKHLPDGGLSKIDLTNFLDNVMLYWVTSSITTSMRIYKESGKSVEELILADIPTKVPTWGLRVKYELLQQPDYMLRWKFTNLLGSTTLDHGGHFAAFELPTEFAQDVFLAVKNFIDFMKK